MREIKFRGKRIDNNEWVYGSLLQSELDVNQIAVKCAIATRFADCYDLRRHEVRPETVGQQFNPSHELFIFSGDLLMAYCSPSGSNKKENRICLVSEDGSGCSISVWYEKEWWAYQSFNWTTVVVIGNIYDNANLLLKEQNDKRSVARKAELITKSR